jgi:elongation factor Ts
MAEISAKLVKELREKTGAGMMDCKKALTETDGDMTKAAEWLRQKGIASADKKSGRTAAEGQIGQYIHTGGRVGVLVEVNCETDFVARGEAFLELVKNVAMQVAACPNVEYVRTEDIPAEIVEREKAIEMGRDDLASKKPEMREKIVEGRIQKRVKELCLLDQPFIRDQSITVEELIKRTIAQVGENIQVRRFARFVLGEGIEKEENTFADEINEQMAKMEAAAEAQDAAEASTETAPEKAPETPVEEAPIQETPVEAPKAEAKAKKGKSSGKKKSK